jgi:dienelactone hydrolase
MSIRRHWLVVGVIFLTVLRARAGEETREHLLKLIDRPRVPAAVEWTPIQDKANGSLQAFHFTYASDADHRVPGILLRKAELAGRRPVVIAMHGTGGTKNGELPLLRILADRGFVALAIEAPHHGERTKAGKGADEYQAAIAQAFRDQGGHGNQHSHPFFFDTVWDVMRLIDVLSERDDVDPNRIGLYGVSKGGIETYLTAAVDPRVAVAVPCIGVQSFRWAIENDSWKSRIGTVQQAFDTAAQEAGVTSPDGKFVHAFYEKVAPGIDGEFDGPAMLPLIAPRPLMIINGDSDGRTPMPGLKLCIDAAESAYRSAGAADHLSVRIQPKTGHKVNPDSQDAAVEWFARWLKPTADTPSATRPAAASPAR